MLILGCRPRVLSNVDAAVVVRLRQAQARAGELAWAQAIETRGKLPANCRQTAGQLPGSHAAVHLPYPCGFQAMVR
jgi:hypothetical protein